MPLCHNATVSLFITDLLLVYYYHGLTYVLTKPFLVPGCTPPAFSAVSVVILILASQNMQALCRLHSFTLVVTPVLKCV